MTILNGRIGTGELCYFHLLVRIELGGDKPVGEIKKRFDIYYGKDDKRELTGELISALRELLTCPLFLFSWKKTGSVPLLHKIAYPKLGHSLPSY